MIAPDLGVGILARQYLRSMPMLPIAFRQLPLPVRLAVPVTFFGMWVWIAEFVIDRYGFDEHLPFYRYGDVCLWEVAIIIALVVLYRRWMRVPAA